MSDNMVPRIAVPDIEDSLLVSNALIAFSVNIAEKAISVESYVRVMRRLTDLLDALSDEASQTVAFRGFGLTPEDLENLDEHAQKLGEKLDGTGE